jgi:hypothetical protein
MLTPPRKAESDRITGWTGLTGKELEGNSLHLPLFTLSPLFSLLLSILLILLSCPLPLLFLIERIRQDSRKESE